MSILFLGKIADRYADDIGMQFWQRVKSAIKTANTTQEWVASKIGVRQDTFSRWIQRDTMPNADQAVAIAHALGVTVEYLVTGQDQALHVVPLRLRDIMADLSAIPPDQLGDIPLLIKVKADACRMAQAPAKQA